jgi:LacI family transcriptional regulator
MAGRRSAPTLKQLADHLNLSMPTVSRALNGYTDISEVTRRRVIEAARAMGYRPHPIAQQLRRQRTDTVGLIMPGARGQFAAPFFLDFLDSVGVALREVGLDLLLAAAPPGPEEMEIYRRWVEGRRIDGLIVARTRVHDERVLYLLEQGVPFVCHGRAGSAESFPYLDLDSRAGFFKATEYLVGLGHTRLGFIGAPSELQFSHHRQAGFREALAVHGLTCPDEWVRTGDLSETSGYIAARSLLSQSGRPTALLCANDAMALGAVYAAQQLGLEVGTDVSVVGYDDLPVARFVSPPLTTLRQPTREAGRRVVELLISHMAGAPAETLQEVWQPELVVRASTGPPRGA